MLKKIIPLFVRDFFRPLFIKYRIYNTQRVHKIAIQKIRKKKKIKVAFLVVYESMWKFDQLYFLLKNDSRFEPVVFICPFITYSKEIMVEEMERTFSNFFKSGYKTIKTMDSDGSFLDIKKVFNPDIVFFTNPWPHSRREYLIHNFLDRLTCYAHYGFKSSNLYHDQFNTDMHNLCWSVFSETKYDLNYAKIFATNKGRNLVVTGYPGVDSLISSNSFSLKNAWKLQEKPKKRIIWAPHHSIEKDFTTSLNYSTFLKYADFMLDIANRYKDELQISFKPHPNLRGKLSDTQLWGKNKTDKYYSKWASLSNGQLDEGDYINLFLESDAMIHDSSSFVLEYLFTMKPVMFLISNEKVFTQFNSLGKKALENIEKGFSKNDILSFLENVIENKDKYLKLRSDFVKENIMPPNNKLASQNIYEYLIDRLIVK